MGSLRECTRILGLDGYRIADLEWETDGPRTRVLICLERRGIRGYECSGCRRRTWQVRDAKPRAWDDGWLRRHRRIVITPRRKADSCNDRCPYPDQLPCSQILTARGEGGI
jgi:hypothetical protein